MWRIGIRLGRHPAKGLKDDKGIDIAARQAGHHLHRTQIDDLDILEIEAAGGEPELGEIFDGAAQQHTHFLTFQVGRLRDRFFRNDHAQVAIVRQRAKAYAILLPQPERRQIARSTMSPRPARKASTAVAPLAK